MSAGVSGLSFGLLATCAFRTSGYLTLTEPPESRSRYPSGVLERRSFRADREIDDLLRRGISPVADRTLQSFEPRYRKPPGYAWVTTLFRRSDRTPSRRSSRAQRRRPKRHNFFHTPPGVKVCAGRLSAVGRRGPRRVRVTLICVSDATSLIRVASAHGRTIAARNFCVSAKGHAPRSSRAAYALASRGG